MKRQGTRTCAVCCTQAPADGFRRFPSSLKPGLQERWMASLDWPDETKAHFLDVWRQKLAQNKDVRWCKNHFEDGSDVPRDVRNIPAIFFHLLFAIFCCR